MYVESQAEEVDVLLALVGAMADEVTGDGGRARDTSPFLLSVRSTVYKFLGTVFWALRRGIVRAKIEGSS